MRRTKPAVGVSTLEAMARNVAHVPGLVICAMDARRQQIYNALFEADAEGQLTRLTPDRAIALAELADELREDSRPKLVVGDGARLCRDFLEEAGIACRLAPPHLLLQNAASVGFAAEQAAGRAVLAPRRTCSRYISGRSRPKSWRSVRIKRRIQRCHHLKIKIKELSYER